MLKILSVAIIALVVFETACDPSDKDIFISNSLLIKGILSDSSENLHLGDSIEFKVCLPDSLNIGSGNIAIDFIKDAQFNMSIYRIDTFRKLPILLKPPLYRTRIGKISNSNASNFIFKETNKPYQVQIIFKPEEKGIYYFAILSQLGRCVINNSFKSSIYIDFALTNKHYNLAVPFFGQAWADGIGIQQSGTYVFKVI